MGETLLVIGSLLAFFVAAFGIVKMLYTQDRGQAFRNLVLPIVLMVLIVAGMMLKDEKGAMRGVPRSFDLDGVIATTFAVRTDNYVIFCREGVGLIDGKVGTLCFQEPISRFHNAERIPKVPVACGFEIGNMGTNQNFPNNKLYVGYNIYSDCPK